MRKLITLNELNNVQEFIKKIDGKSIVVYEDIQGSTIFVNYSNGEMKIKTTSLSNKPLNYIDYTIQVYYKQASSFFESLEPRVKKLMNSGWWFAFEYFSDEQPANIAYDYKPKNGLILKGIHKGRKARWSDNIEEIQEYARLFDVDIYPTIFSGVLTDEQVELIQKYLTTSKEDLEYVFDETNFSRFFYRLLSPGISSSALMNDGKYQENTEKILIRLNDTSEVISFQILNPFYDKIHSETNTSYLTEYSIILLNFIEFLQVVNLDEIDIQGTTKDRAYVDLMCKLFNAYYEYTRGAIKDVEYSIPEFFAQDKFRLNKEKILNPKTYFLISDNKLEWIFKCILGSFYKIKKNVIGIWTDTTLALYNLEVENISNRISKHLNIVSQEVLASAGFMSFDTFRKVRYPEEDQQTIDSSSFDELFDKEKKSLGFDKDGIGIGEK